MLRFGNSSSCFLSLLSAISTFTTGFMDARWRISRTLLVFIAVYLLLSSALAADVSYCDKKGNYAVKVAGVEILPNPVLSGKPATFNISASTGKAISGGKVVIGVSYFGIHVHSETRNLCEELSCPISPGSFVLSHTQTLPSFTPPGSYILRMTMKDDKNKQLTCISFDFTISLRSALSDS